MVSMDHLNRSIEWAAGQLDAPTPLAPTRVSITPWSASAALDFANTTFWVKAAHPQHSRAESEILDAACRHGLSGVPNLIAADPHLNAVLLDDVPTTSAPWSRSEALTVRDNICAVLTDRSEFSTVPALSVQGCAEAISRDCGSGWLKPELAISLAQEMNRSPDLFESIDAELSGPPQLLHGDFHPGNVLSGLSGPVCIDWADARFGSAAWDYAMFASAYENSASTAGRGHDVYPLLASLKALSDLTCTPIPSRGQECTISLVEVRRHINRLAVTVLESVRSVRRSYLRGTNEPGS